jgi:hypothetical protein
MAGDDRVRLLPVCEPGRGPREPVEIRDEWAKRMADDLDRFKRITSSDDLRAGAMRGARSRSSLPGCRDDAR